MKFGLFCRWSPKDLKLRVVQELCSKKPVCTGKRTVLSCARIALSVKSEILNVFSRAAEMETGRFKAICSLTGNSMVLGLAQAGGRVLCSRSGAN